MFTGLSAVILYVKDIERAKDFYINMLGFTLNYDDGKDVSLEVHKSSASKVDLNAYDDPANFPGHQTLIPKAGDIEEAYDELKKKVKIVQPLKEASWGKTFYFVDPDGNRIEVVE